jgi:hypothetical protein
MLPSRKLSLERREQALLERKKVFIFSKKLLFDEENSIINEPVKQDCSRQKG